LEQSIRPYSHAGIAIMRSLHDLRYFAGINTRNVSQRKAIETYINGVFYKNVIRAKEGKCHLTYEECKKHARESLGEGNAKHLGAE
jgi:hypothetical protein